MRVHYTIGQLAALAPHHPSSHPYSIVLLLITHQQQVMFEEYAIFPFLSSV